MYERVEPSYFVKIISTSGGVPKILDSLREICDVQWRPDGRTIRRDKML